MSSERVERAKRQQRHDFKLSKPCLQCGHCENCIDASIEEWERHNREQAEMGEQYEPESDATVKDLRNRPGQYATEDGKIDTSSVRARAVNNALFIEHIGGGGDIAAIGLGTKEFAEDVAGELNLIFNTFRASIDAAMATTGRIAHESSKREQRMRDRLLRIFARCENCSPVDVRANVADALGMTVEALEESTRDAT